MSAVWIPLDGSEFVVVSLRRSSRRRAAPLEVQDPQKARTYHAVVPMVDVPMIDGVQMHELRAFADAPSKWDERFVNRVALPACFGSPILYGPVVFVHEDPAVALDDDMFYDLWIRWLARPLHRNIGVLGKANPVVGGGSGSTRVSPVTRTLTRLRRTSRDRFGTSVAPNETKDEEPTLDDDDDDDTLDHGDEDIVSSDDDERDDEDDDDLSDDDFDQNDDEEDPEEDVPVARRTRRRRASTARQTTKPRAAPTRRRRAKS